MDDRLMKWFGNGRLLASTQARAEAFQDACQQFGVRTVVTYRAGPLPRADMIDGTNLSEMSVADAQMALHRIAANLSVCACVSLPPGEIWVTALADLFKLSLYAAYGEWAFAILEPKEG